LGDGGAPALGDGPVIVLPRLAALLEGAFDDVPVGLHAQAGDGGPVRQREDVRGLQGLAVRVAETLGERHVGDQAGDRGPYVEVVEGKVAPLGTQAAE